MTPRTRLRSVSRPTAPASAVGRWLPVLVLAGAVLALRSAETGNRPENSGLPLGSIVAFAGPATAIPEADGWMLCDGRELATAAHKALHTALGGAWGTGTVPETFRLPDLRGRFLRGVSYEAAGQARDPDRDQREPLAPSGHPPNEVGSLQADQAGAHVHALTGTPDAIGPGAGAEWIRFHAQKVPDESAPVIANRAAVQSNQGSETRPVNVYVNWIIRVR